MESLINMLISEETKILLSVANIGALVFVIWFVARIYFTFKNKSEQQDEAIKDHADKISTLETEHTKIKITQAVIETKLENIEAGIAEIKTMLIPHLNKE